jgi:hypothetical protein
MLRRTTMGGGGQAQVQRLLFATKTVKIAKIPPKFDVIYTRNESARHKTSLKSSPIFVHSRPRNSIHTTEILENVFGYPSKCGFDVFYVCCWMAVLVRSGDAPMCRSVDDCVGDSAH